MRRPSSSRPDACWPVRCPAAAAPRAKMARRASCGARPELGARPVASTPTANRRTAMRDLIKVIAVQPLAGHWLRVSFSDGAVKDVDVGALLAGGGVFTDVRARR